MQRAGEGSRPRSPGTPLAIPHELALELSAAVARWGSRYVVTDGLGGQTSTWAIERAVRSARKRIPGLPEGFRFHDLRHYLASLLIGSGLDVKVVQHRLRHGSADHTWTPTATSGRTATSQPGPPLVRCWRPGLTEPQIESNRRAGDLLVQVTGPSFCQMS